MTYWESPEQRPVKYATRIEILDDTLGCANNEKNLESGAEFWTEAATQTVPRSGAVAERGTMETAASDQLFNYKPSGSAVNCFCES